MENKQTLQKFKERFILRQNQLPEHSRNIQLAHFCLSSSSSVETETTNAQINQTLDIEGVKEKFGVYPNQIVDYLALMGDKSDNVPGIPGVGKKTATKWLNEFKTLENLPNLSFPQ